MKQNKSVLTALTLSGLLGLSLAPGWAQMKPSESSGPASPGSSQKEQGTSPTTSRSGQMKSSETGKSAEAGKGMETGEQASAKGAGGQWGKDDIKKVQEALKEKGNDPGPVDGVLGPQTQKALRAFQQANGIKTSGRLDAATAKALGVEKGSSAMGKGSSSMEHGSASEKGSSPGASSGAHKGKEPSSK